MRYSKIVKQSYHQADASLDPQTQARSEQSDSQFSSREHQHDNLSAGEH